MNVTISKSKLIKEIKNHIKEFEDLNYTFSDIEVILDALEYRVLTNVKAGNKVVFGRFGHFVSQWVFPKKGKIFGGRVECDTKGHDKLSFRPYTNGRWE